MRQSTFVSMSPLRYIIYYCFSFFLFVPFFSVGQDAKSEIKNYVEKYGESAKGQMAEFKIPASVILAQAIFESNCGSSELALRSNNHFGIKCHLEWGGDTILKSDDTVSECFRKYNSVEDSYLDHSLFLNSRARYSNVFQLLITDYKAWCYGLKNSGYATFGCYTEELIKIIEENELWKLDWHEQLPPTISNIKIQKKLDLCKFEPVRPLRNDDIPHEYLFTDERDVLIQNLDLIIEEVEEESIVVKE
jgi:hypothetical protein